MPNNDNNNKFHGPKPAISRILIEKSHGGDEKRSLILFMICPNSFLYKPFAKLSLAFSAALFTKGDLE